MTKKSVKLWLILLALGASFLTGSAVFAEDGGDAVETGAEQQAEQAAQWTLKFSHIDGTEGTFTAAGQRDPADGTVTVEFDVWHASDKSDLYTYRGSSSHAARVDVANHKHHFGEYTVQMYEVAPDGTRTAAARQTVDLKALNYIYAQAANKARTKYTVRVLNPRSGGKAAKSVKMPTWSRKKGKTDRIVYKAKKYSKAGNSWQITVQTKKHMFDGIYYTQVLYNGKKDLGKVSYKAQRPLSTVEQMAEARLDKTGRSLKAAFKWSYRMKYKYLNPRKVRQCDKMAAYGFEHRKGNCAVMAAAFYHMARRLGYDAHYVCGYVPLRGGRLGRHAWVEIRQSGRIWVYDPDFQHESHRKGFKIRYKKPGTWRYTRYSRVN